jgi:hypothetical protein
MDSDEKKSSWASKWVYISLALTIVVICLCPVACTTINKKLNLDDDNIAEEILEAVIEDRFNLDIDLSPESPENTPRNSRS